jgi:hypothetical protein
VYESTVCSGVSIWTRRSSERVLTALRGER